MDNECVSCGRRYYDLPDGAVCRICRGVFEVVRRWPTEEPEHGA